MSIVRLLQNIEHHSLWYPGSCWFSSVQSLSRVYLWPYGLKHTRLPCPSPIAGVYSNSRPTSRWDYPTISSSVVPFSSCLQSFPASGSFIRSQFFTSGGQSIQLQHQSFQWIFRTDFLSDWLVGFPCSLRDSSLLQHHSSRASILWCSASFIVWLSHPYMTPRKTIALTRWIFVGKVPIGWLLLLVTYFQI